MTLSSNERSFDALRARLDAAGLNLVGCAAVAAYDAAVPAALAIAPVSPAARTAVVIGNGGRALWTRFSRARGHGGRAGPGRSAHPLDEYTRAVVGAALGPLPPGARVLWPFLDAEPRVSFVHLAECAGLGRPSLLGVLVHPEYGPWIALRAAVLLPFGLDAPRPADGFDPCGRCLERPCRAACPAAAVGPTGFDRARCVAERLAAHPDACASGCHARVACPHGRAHRYPDEALAFHQAAARAAMARWRPG